jgi:methionyl-tRNA formyltransferase
MKIALFADSHVGLEIAKFIFREFSKDIAVVFCVRENKIYNLALKNNLNCKIFDNDKDAADTIKALNVEIGVLAWWPYIISKPVIASAEYGFINTHNSYLPNNRGKHPYYWAVIEECEYGVTLHWVDEGIDTGDIIAQRLIKISWEDDAESIYSKSLSQMIELFKDTYPVLRAGGMTSKPQAISGSFHYGNELDRHSQIKLDKQYVARDLLNIIRARTTSSKSIKPAFFIDHGKKYRVKILIEED